MLKNNTMNVKSNKALIYFIFSIAVGVAIGLIFSEFFLNKKAKLSYTENNLSYSYSEAVIKASPAVVNIYSQQVINQSRDSRRSCLLYTSPSPRDKRQSRMPSSA